MMLSSLDEDCLAEYMNEMKTVAGEAFSSDEDLIDLLLGHSVLEENADLPDGEVKCQDRVEEIRKKYVGDPRHWKNSQWLLVCCPTSKLEESQRQRECEHFIANIPIPGENIIRKTVERIDGIYEFTTKFIDDHKDMDYHIYIVIIGHGSVRTVEERQFRTGVLSVKCANVPKVHVDTIHIVDMINDKAKECSTSRTGSIFLSLFYCYAQEGTKDHDRSDIKVLFYKNGTVNPRSIMTKNRERTECLKAKNMALVELAERVGKAVDGRYHEIHESQSAPANLQAAGDSKSTQLAVDITDSSPCSLNKKWEVFENYTEPASPVAAAVPETAVGAADTNTELGLSDGLAEGPQPELTLSETIVPEYESSKMEELHQHQHSHACPPKRSTSFLGRVWDAYCNMFG